MIDTSILERVEDGNSRTSTKIQSAGGARRIHPAIIAVLVIFWEPVETIIQSADASVWGNRWKRDNTCRENTIHYTHNKICYSHDCILNRICYGSDSYINPFNWAAPNEFGTYRLCEQRRFRRACASAQSRQNLRCSLIQAVSQEEPSDRKPDPWPLWMAGHAQLKFVMTECSKTQIRLARLNLWLNETCAGLKHLKLWWCNEDFKIYCCSIRKRISKFIVFQSEKGL